MHVGERYSEARAVAVDGEGRIVLASLSSRSIGLTRLLADGSVDPAFGDGGIVTTSVGTASIANAVLVEPDGRIVAVGCTSSEDASSYALVRYTADGALDPTFGDGRVVVTPSTGYPDIKALARLPDGRLVAVGSAVVADDVTNTGFLVARYLPDGSLDPAFDGDGLAMVDVRGALDDHAEDVVVLPDGRIVVGGTSNDPDPVTTVSSDVAVARLLEDGTLDPTFGSDGTVRVDLGPGYDALGGLALQPDGALVAAGDVDPYAAGPLVAARFTEAGELDPSFGSGGVTTTDLGHPSRASAVAVQDSGRILVAGVTGPPDDPLWALLAYTPDGALDASFDGDGVARTAAGRGAHALALEPDGDAVVAGCDCPELQFDRSGHESVSSFVAVRYAGGR